MPDYEAIERAVRQGQPIPESAITTQENHKIFDEYVSHKRNLIKLTEYILCAAVKINVNSETLVISGYRHGDCFNIIKKLCLIKCIAQIDEGFLTSSGRFVDRIEAKKIAKQANQLIRDSVFSKLISEDIY